MFDVVVVGGGPAGLSATLSLGRSRRRVLLVDAGDGRNARTAAVHGFLTNDGAAPADLRAAAHRELGQYPALEVRQQRVVGVSGAEGDFTVVLENDERVRTRRVLLATGVRDDLPDIPGLAELWGRGVFHCPYCHGYEVRDEPIAVLVHEPGDVTMVGKLACYTDELVACTSGTVELDDDHRALLDKLGVTLRTERIARLESVEDRLRRVVFSEGEPVSAAALFVHGSTRQASDVPAALGCRFLEDGSIAVDELQQTSVDGVYAAGDIARHPAMPLPGAMVSLAVAAGTIAAVGLDQDLLRLDLDPPGA